MLDTKSGQLRPGLRLAALHFLNEPLQMAFHHPFLQLLHLTGLPLHPKLHRSIRQVFHKTGHIAPHRHLLHTVAKPHSLHPARVNVMVRNHRQTQATLYSDVRLAPQPIISNTTMAINFSDISTMTLFRGFDDSFVRLLDVFFEEKTFNTDDVIVEYGNVQRDFYIIISGEVEVRSHADSPTGSTVLNTISAGEFFGEINLFDPGEATASVVALTPVVSLVISNERFRNFIRRKPELAADFSYQLAETIVKRFRRSQKIINEELHRPENIELSQNLDDFEHKA